MQYIIAEETKGVLNMREYVTPRMTGETFASNEYISVCWGVSCITNRANSIEENYYHRPLWPGGPEQAGVTHRPEFCGNSLNQHIEANSEGVATGMVETGTDGLGNLTCTLYTNDHYNQTGNFADVDIGDTIYWTTSAGNKTWHHVGLVEGVDDNHPNRS